MPRIIVTSRYLKSGTSGTRGNLVKYIATRETVEIYTSSQKGLPATNSQQELIEKLIEMFPTEKLSHEYKDYHSQPTKENASKLISELLERNADLITDRQMLVKYISERPGVEKLGKHGLFTDECGEVDLTEVMNTIANHNGNIWSHVVSLKREDAERLGYITPQMWQELVKNSIAEIANAQNIPIDNIRWYAAFHNTAHHPHIHLLVYSVVPNQGYLTAKGIDMIRSEFANKIFANDLQEIYQQQTRVRDDLRAEAKRKVQELSSKVQNHIISPQLEALIQKLSQQLQAAKGKKVYGYLQPPVKKTVDDIVAMLADHPTIKKMYDKWCRLEQEKYNTYTNAVKQFPPLHENKVFKPIKNSVINAVLEMSHTLGSAECNIKEDDALPEPEMNANLEDAEIPDEDMDFPIEDTSPTEHNGYYAKWTDEYREARDLIRSGEEYDRAYELLKPEADDGNVIAIYELAKMYDRRLLGEDNKNAAEQYYKTALAGFIEVEKSADKMKPFFQYRIGAMYNYGQGTEQDYTEAFKWFQSSAAAGNQYAMFALGNLYNYGKGVEKDVTKAFHWYRQSAEKNNAYAAYMAARMLQNGTGTEKNTEQAEKYYKTAYEGFRSMEKNTRDGDLLYKLGIMTMNVIGCEADKNAGAEYLRRGAELKNAHSMCEYGKMLVEGKMVTKDTDRGIALLDESAVTNENARYYLGKLFLKGEYVYPNPELAIKLFHTCGDNPFALYALGKIYLDGRYAAKDHVLAEQYLLQAAEHELDCAEYALGKLYLDDSVRQFDLAEEYLNRAARHGSEFAMYRLAKLYLSGDIPLNTEKAVEWLQKAADKLSTAAYALGKLYMFGKEVPQDRELAVYWLTRASDMGNELAQHLLEHIDSFEHSRVQNAYMNMLLAFARLIRENYDRTDRNLRMQTDKKLRAAIRRKKQALGIKEDHTIKQG